MKKLLSVIAFGLLIISHAEAGTPLIELSTSGGFAPGVILSTGILVQDDGIIYGTQKRGSSLSRKTHLLTLSSEKLKSLTQVIAKLQPSELEDLNPEGGRCMDAPSITIRVFQSNTKVFEIYKFENCHEYHLHAEKTRLIVQFIKGLDSLSNL
jgi:hypothetical protein